jgi:3-deoxy-D-manno-octulosonate cytidylyltransferase
MGFWSGGIGMNITIVIPARYASSRFPGKPLADIHGKPMIQHVYERSCQARCTDQVIVATDDRRIADVVRRFGGTVMMTSEDHPSGTDRVVEIAQRISADVYINVQGDEPLIRPEDIDLLAGVFRQDHGCQVATLCHPISTKEALDVNKVKLVTSHSGNVMYFSRTPIPYVSRRHAHHLAYLKHIGIYGYKAAILNRYKLLPASSLEQHECLEQLRLLQADVPIKAVVTSPTGPGVDTPACLERVKEIMAHEILANREMAN